MDLYIQRLNNMKKGQEPAFPIPSDGATHGSYLGLTKREYIATQMINSIIQNSALFKYLHIEGEDLGMPGEDAIAKMSCKYADVLLEELEKE